MSSDTHTQQRNTPHSIPSFAKVFAASVAQNKPDDPNSTKTTPTSRPPRGNTGCLSINRVRACHLMPLTSHVSHEVMATVKCHQRRKQASERARESDGGRKSRPITQRFHFLLYASLSGDTQTLERRASERTSATLVVRPPSRG